MSDNSKSADYTPPVKTAKPADTPVLQTGMAPPPEGHEVYPRSPDSSDSKPETTTTQE